MDPVLCDKPLQHPLGWSLQQMGTEACQALANQLLMLILPLLHLRQDGVLGEGVVLHIELGKAL